VLRRSLCLVSLAIIAAAILCNRAQAQTLTEYYFGGYDADSSLIQANDGYLYGSDGGFAVGDIYRMGLSGTPQYAIFYSFNGDNDSPAGIVQGVNGALYGAGGYPFEYTFAGTFTDFGDGNLVGYNGTLEDGLNPVPANDGNLYFTSQGTIPALLRLNTSEGVLYYLGAPPASSSWTPLQASDGYLYDPVTSGGANGAAIVYRANLS
jgi:hypothetical protein